MDTDLELIEVTQGCVERTLERVLDFYYQHEDNYRQFHKNVEDYNPHAVAGVIYGVLLLLFGRDFIFTFVVVESLRHSGVHRVFAYARRLQRRNELRRRRRLAMKEEKQRRAAELVQSLSKQAKGKKGVTILEGSVSGPRHPALFVGEEVDSATSTHAKSSIGDPIAEHDHMLTYPSSRRRSSSKIYRGDSSSLIPFQPEESKGKDYEDDLLLLKEDNSPELFYYDEHALSNNVLYTQHMATNPMFQYPQHEGIDEDEAQDAGERDRDSLRSEQSSIQSGDEPEGINHTGLMTRISALTMKTLAVVKVSLAQYLALGLSLGDDFNRFFQRVLTPPLKRAIPSEAYHPYIPQVIEYTTKAIGVIVSLVGYRYINIVATSVRGAFSITINLQILLRSMQIDNLLSREDTHADFLMVCGLILVGVLFQLFGYRQLPMQIRAIFFPAFLLERFLDHVQMSMANHHHKAMIGKG